MKTFPLRELLRKPKTVKQLTAAGQRVRITDNGRPLWVIHPVEEEPGNAFGDKDWLESMLDEVLNERPVARLSAGRIVLESRR